jgi:hypothetical protein
MYKKVYLYIEHHVIYSYSTSKPTFLVNYCTPSSLHERVWNWARVAKLVSLYVVCSYKRQ